MPVGAEEQGIIEQTRPLKLVNVNPPEGTVMYGQEIRGEQKLTRDRFGLVDIAQGRVDGGSAGATIDGSYLQFNPGVLRISVGRQDLTADEINRIGRISAELDDSFRISSFLNQVLGPTKAVVDGLRMFASATGSEAKTEEMDVKTNQELEEMTGVSPVKMREGQTKLSKKIDELMIEANGLGVTVIESAAGGLQNGLSVKLHADNTSKQTQSPDNAKAER